MKHTIYLDHAATTGVRREVLQAMLPYFSENSGNASALHQLGERSRTAVTQARKTIARLLRGKPEEIFFTSGGSEADNWVIKTITAGCGFSRPHIITTSIEHHAVLNSCHYMEEQGCSITYLQPDTDGVIHPRQIRQAIRPETVLVSVMYANNEIGTIQPIDAISQEAFRAGVPFHTDAVQALGQIPIPLDQMPITFLSASAHKLGGPKGTGLLFMREGIDLPPFIHGGAQEMGFRAGTENVPGIVGFASAVSYMYQGMKQRFQKVSQLRNYLARQLLALIPGIRINGTMQNRLPGNLNMLFPGINAGNLLMLLDREGICVSAGAACSARDAAPSHVLLAIGLTPDQARSSLRFSIGEENTYEELQYTAHVIKRLVEGLRH